jgi:ABC-type sugar transport system permease subunit
MFKSFDLIWIITKGGPGDATDTLSTLAYRSAFEGFNTGYGSSIATVIFLVLFLVSLVYVTIPVVRNERGAL